jgi:hypothetical protein
MAYINPYFWFLPVGLKTGRIYLLLFSGFWGKKSEMLPPDNL